MPKQSFPGRSLFLIARNLAVQAIAGATLMAAAAPTPPPASIQVPPGFEVIRVAAPPLVTFPMLGGFDERGRLFMAENAGVNLSQEALVQQTPSRVTMLEDTDGDGIFDRSTTFADKLTFPQGAQWHGGSLFVASAPSIWRLEDADGDGRSDSRREIATGFKSTGNAADVHGPFLHPSGRLYWCHGRKGHEVYQQDGSLVSKGLGARIWSVRPDGTDIQVHAGGGMDNPAKVTFNQEGDVFGTVNIYRGSPRSDAVIHWIHGGVYPRTDQEPVLAEFRRSGDLLTALALLGHVAPSGTTLVQHETWGPEFQGNVFLAEFNTRRIMRIALERDGATFRGRPEVFASTATDGVHFTDVIEDADGSLLVVDTGAWFRMGCPTSGVARPDIVGGIYRIRRAGATRPADPRGNSIPWAQLSPAAMIEYLGDSRPAVRERAVSGLARKGDAAVAALGAALGDRRYLARSNAVWALTRIGTPAARAAARRALGDSDFRIRQVACQSVFTTIDQNASDELTALLADEAPAVKREAARALGRLKNPAAIPALADAAAATENDPVLMHAFVQALNEIEHPAEIRKLLAHRHPRGRRAGLIALSQIPNGDLAAGPVFDALRSPDAELRSAALPIAIKRTQWGPAAADFLPFAFADAKDTARTEAGASILNAFIAAPEVRAWVRTQLDPSATGAPRLALRTAIDAIASATGTWDDGWRGPLLSALRSPDLALAQAALRAIATHRARDFGAELLEVSRDSARPTAFRVAALQTAAGGDKVMEADAFQMLVEPFITGGSPEARMQAASVLAGSKLDREQVLKLVDLVPAAGPMELPQLLGAFQRGPADPEVAAQLLAKLKTSPARWSLVPGEVQAVFRRFRSPAPEDAAPLVSEIMNQAVAKESRVTELEKVATGGDAARGRAAFIAGTGACVSCHRVGDVGARMGPDLSQIGRIRNARDLLEAIAFPDATIARGYESFRLETKTGETLMGTIPRETSEQVIIGTIDNREVPVPRASIAKLEAVANSLMPPGLDRALDPKALADLIAFLKSLQ